MNPIDDPRLLYYVPNESPVQDWERRGTSVNRIPMDMLEPIIALWRASGTLERKEGTGMFVC
jgi:hypothetical protein